MESRIKLFSTPQVESVTSLKDFNQKDIYGFLIRGGDKLYGDIKNNFSSIGNKRLSSFKRGVFNKITINKYLNKKLSIINPFNDIEYFNNDFISIGNIKKDYEPVIDLKIVIHNGYIEFPEFDSYVALVFILAKYHKPESTWQYRFIKIGTNSPKPIITIPTIEEDWEDVLKSLLEYLSIIKLFTGDIYKIYLCQSNEEVPEEKYFGISMDKIINYIPASLMVIYNKFISKAFEKGVIPKWQDTAKVKYSPGLKEKIIKYAEEKYKDELIIANIGQGSFFLDTEVALKSFPQARQILDPEKLGAMNANPDRKRTMYDYVALAIREHKNLIGYSDRDPVPAIAHEIGHFLVSKEKTLKSKCQENSKLGIFSDKFIKFYSGVFGGIGGFFSTNGITDVVGFFTAMALKSPELISEFYASYYGIEILEKVGATKDDIEKAKSALKLAYSTYINNAIKQASKVGYGRFVGGGARALVEFKKKLS